MRLARSIARGCTTSGRSGGAAMPRGSFQAVQHRVAVDCCRRLPVRSCSKI
jgi:hypothetical protein